jgi:thiamine-phosphate pyrophosphorylase
VLLYYITDRSQFSGDEQAKRERLLQKIGEASRGGVDLIQLREKDLTTRHLESLAMEVVHVCRANGPAKLLINSRTDVALASRADGVHLTSSDISPADARAIWDVSMRSQSEGRRCTVGISCHKPEEVRLAESHGADFAVFAPVFEKAGTKNPGGLEALREASQRVQPVAKTEAGKAAGMPVLALGGITLENAALCIAIGAAGIAAVRLFQENNIADVVRRLRGL